MRHRITDPVPDERRGVCTECGPVRIYRASVYKGRTYWRCGDATRSNVKARREQNIDQVRNARFLRLYGITLDEYNQMMEDQGGACARCRTPVTEQSMLLSVDHCHKTGRVRSLLCGPCNTYLGRLEANRDRLEEDLAYLDGFAEVIIARL